MGQRGIDVSAHNGSLSWSAVKSCGISFAIIRAGYGRYQVDSCFRANVEGAAAQGIPVGVYWFSYALNEDGARQEARKCLETIQGCNLRLPVFYDFEYDTIRYAQEQGVTLGKAEFNAFARAFLEIIEEAGYTPGIYYNLDYYKTMVDESVVGGYCVWYAQYASSISASAPKNIAIWQYSGSGTLTGLSGQFDLNELLDESLLDYSGPTGWVKDGDGWKYIHEDGGYTTDGWEKIDGIWYYFDGEGYMLSEQWVYSGGNAYYLDADGAMVTNRTLIIDGEGRLVPGGKYYERLCNVSGMYRGTVDKLIEMGVLTGKGGSGEDMILDLSEDAVRLLVILDRAGVFDRDAEAE